MISSYIPDLRLTEDEKDLSHATANTSTQTLMHKQTFEPSKDHQQQTDTSILSQTKSVSQSGNSSLHTPKIIVVPSGEVRKKYRPVPLKYTTSVVNNTTSGYEQTKTQVAHGQYSVIASSWFGQYVNGQ